MICRAAAAGSLACFPPLAHRNRRLARSRVAVVPAEQYSARLEDALWNALKLFNLDLHHRTVLLKPNLVDYISGVETNTHPLVVAAAVECFRRLGAAKVTVGEGPGHQRDTELLLAATGLGAALEDVGAEFLDLNRDDLSKVRLRSNYSGLKEMWLPQTILDADFIVSMPKVKTHHWSGVTLGAKNMFGIVPGVKYGWPKNILHWRGIDRCILDITATVAVNFVIADAIVCMEGNGPLAGTARRLDSLVISDDVVAADATCARLMGFAPERISYLRSASNFLGNMASPLIDMLACSVKTPDASFATVPEFGYLAAKR